jgi:uncharacterized membrane protein
MESLFLIGFVFILIGILLIFIGSISSMKEGQTNIKSAGGIFLGPIPIFGFFSDKKMFYFLVVMAIVVFILWMVFRKYLF